MTTSQAPGIYRGLLRLYPRRFRDEYGPDMALLFADQLADESAARVWTRGLVDLAITIPARHLEAHVNRPPNPTVPFLFAGLSLAGIVLAIVGGSNLGSAGLGVAVAVVTGILAVASWRHARVITGEARLPATHWWKLTLGGVSVLAAVIIAVNLNGEVPDGWWWPMMFTLLASIMTTAGGLILGIAHLLGHRLGHAR